MFVSVDLKLSTLLASLFLFRFELMFCASPVQCNHDLTKNSNVTILSNPSVRKFHLCLIIISYCDVIM